MRRLTILAVVFALTRILPALFMPLVLDEALYSVMVEEQFEAQKLIPTFLGHPVSWKPFLFFSVYSVSALLDFLPLELAYRLPSLILGLATIPLLLDIFRRCRIGEGISFLSVLIYLISFPSIYPNAAALTDTLAFFLICLSLWIYTRSGPPSRFALAAAAVFAAFFVKLVLAFIVPVLALCYFLQYRRKEIGPAFLASLLAAPLAMLLHYLLLDQVGLASELYFWDVGGHFVSAQGVGGQAGMLIQSFGTLVSSGMILWLGLSAISFIRMWRDNMFLSAWYLLSLIPIMVSTTIFWYFLPVLPAISFFAACTLGRFEGKERFDRFFLIVFSLMAASSLAVALFNYSELYSRHDPEREAGHLLSGKENVIVLGKYRPGIVAYKILDEAREGRKTDFGWVVVSSAVSVDDAMIYASDYLSGKHPVTQGSFSAFFTRDSVFRKDTHLARFDYIAVAGSHPAAPEGAALIYNKSDISVYEVK